MGVVVEQLIIEIDKLFEGDGEMNTKTADVGSLVRFRYTDALNSQARRKYFGGFVKWTPMAHSALSVIDVYEQLLSAPDDKTRARIIATAFERLEDRYPELKDLATATGVRETELRLLKKIEKIRQDTQQIRADMHQTELRLQKEIAEVNLKIEMTSKKQVQWMVGLFFTFAFTLIAAMFGVSML